MNFSFNQNQPQQQPFQMGQQQQQYYQQPNFLQQQAIQNKQIHQETLKRVLKNFFDIQNQPQFQQLIQIITCQQKLAKQCIDKATDQKDINVLNRQKMQQLFKRGQKMKQRNSILLNRVLLAKSKLERLMYHDMNQNSKYQYETSLAMDKIRTLKSQITQKCAYLKTLKVNKSIEHGQKRNVSKSKFSISGTGLTELKNGAEVLQREVLKKKTQMELVVKYINQGN